MKKIIALFILLCVLCSSVYAFYENTDTENIDYDKVMQTTSNGRKFIFKFKKCNII